MSKTEYNIGTIGVDGKQWSCGIAYVAIPQDIDRTQFVTECVMQGTLSIKTIEGGYIHNCPTTISLFDIVEFPEVPEEMGTPVVYVTEPLHQQPIVIGALNFNDNILNREEAQFLLQRQFKNSIITFAGSAQDETITISVNGVEKSEMHINLTNADKRAKLEFSIDGDWFIKTLGVISFISYTSISHVVKNDDAEATVTHTAKEYNVTANRISLNEGTQSMVRGNDLADLLRDLIMEVSRSTVTTSLGQMPLLNALKIGEFTNRLDKILSDSTFTE